MRKSLALAAVAVVIVSVAAQNPKPDEKEPPKQAGVLSVGDPAPPLKVTKWLQGAEVKAFAPGKVHVVVFWATWSPPSIAIMPHLSDLQAEYRDKGVTFIGFTARDPNNTPDKVTAFIEKRGPKLGYAFAYAEDRETYAAWVMAAKQVIPCAFVVGKDGKIAFIGLPTFLDEVLPKVVAGTWTKNDVDEMKKVEKEVDDVFKAISGPDAAAGLKALADFNAKHPKLVAFPHFIGPRITMLLKTKKSDEARKTAEEVLAQAIKNDDPLAIRTVYFVLRSPAANNDKELLALAVKAAEAYLKVVGDKDAFALLTVADAYFATGEREKARGYGAKALAAAATESEGMKKFVQLQVKKFEEEKKDK